MEDHLRQYDHRFRVRAPLAAVAEFHTRSASMPAITPPPVVVRLHSAPVVQREGDELDFTLWMGPLPVHWIARIESLSENGFTDRQVRGPFRQWIHQHTYNAVDDCITEVHDRVQIELSQHPLWGPVGMIMWLTLPVLFAYRAFRTRQLMEKRA